MIPDTLEVHSNWWIYLYTKELFFQASLLIRIVRQLYAKMSYGHVTKISRDDGLLSEPATDW